MKRHEAGFTLIEVLIVISILGIILSIGTPKLMCTFNERDMEKSKVDSQFIADLIEKTEERYKHNVYKTLETEITTDELINTKKWIESQFDNFEDEENTESISVYVGYYQLNSDFITQQLDLQNNDVDKFLIIKDISTSRDELHPIEIEIQVPKGIVESSILEKEYLKKFQNVIIPKVQYYSCNPTDYYFYGTHSVSYNSLHENLKKTLTPEIKEEYLNNPFQSIDENTPFKGFK